MPCAMVQQLSCCDPSTMPRPRYTGNHNHHSTHHQHSTNSAHSSQLTALVLADVVHTRTHTLAQSNAQLLSQLLFSTLRSRISVTGPSLGSPFRSAPLMLAQVCLSAPYTTCTHWCETCQYKNNTGAPGLQSIAQQVDGGGLTHAQPIRAGGLGQGAVPNAV
jgi:hypothetical protein